MHVGFNVWRSGLGRHQILIQLNKRGNVEAESGSAETHIDLLEKLKSAWATAIDEQYCYNFISSMPSMSQTVLDARGSHTQH